MAHLVASNVMSGARNWVPGLHSVTHCASATCCRVRGTLARGRVSLAECRFDGPFLGRGGSYIGECGHVS